MKKMIIFILLLLVSTSFSYGEDKLDLDNINYLEEYILVELSDGTVEARPISMYNNIDIFSRSSLKTSSDISVDIAILNALNSEDVVLAERIQPIFLHEEPDDVHNEDKWRFDYTKMTDIWNDTLAENSVVVAVIDSGIYPHTDLNLLSGWSAYSTSTINSDVSGHGTHVAGIIGSIRDNSPSYIVGIAPGISIKSIKVFNDDDYGDTASLANGINEVVRLVEEENINIKVINMSLEYEGYSEIINNALIKAENAGIVVIAATGNDSSLWVKGEEYDIDNSNFDLFKSSIMNYPAALPNVIAVGSVSKHSTEAEIGISDFSNIGDDNFLIDVVAPGGEILSLYDRQNGIDEELIYKSGTSMASPHVAGLAALILNKFPTLTTSEVREVIRNTAYDPNIVIPASLDRNKVIGNGIINIYNGLNLLSIDTLTIKENDIVKDFNFDSNVEKYNLDFSIETSEMKINATRLLNSDTTKIVYELNDDTYENNNILTEETVISLPNISKSILYIKIENTNGKSREYQISINKDFGNKISLISLKHDNEELLTFDEDTYEYSIAIPSGADPVQFEFNSTMYEPTNGSMDISYLSIENEVYENNTSKLISILDGDNVIVLKSNHDDPLISPLIYTINVYRNYDTNVDLSNLVVVEKSLNETFDKNDLEYTLNVLYNTTEVTINPILLNSKGSYKIEKNSVEVVNNIGLLEVGNNEFVITVTSESTFETKVYKLNVNRGVPSSDSYLTELSVADMTLNQNFDSTVLTYSGSVLYNVNIADISFVKSNEFATVDISSRLLIVGENIINVEVTAEDLTNKIYQLTVTRNSATNMLSQLIINGYNLNPVFQGSTTNYSLTVPNSISSIQYSLILLENDASVKVNNEVYTIEDNFNLNVGSNTLNIVVTGADSATNTYTVIISREAPAISSPPSGGGVSAPSGGGSTPPPAPVPLKEDIKETIKNEDGTKKEVTIVSKERIIDELKDDSKEKLEILASQSKEENTEVSISSAVLDILKESEKKIEIQFKNVTFVFDNSIIKSLGIKKEFKILHSVVSDLKSVELNNKNIISDIVELDIFDGDIKIRSLKKSIPIILDYDPKNINNKKNIAIYYLDEESNKWVYVGGKVLSNGKIKFEARHFSKYAILENKKTFTDITNHWAKEAIEALASREITSGVSEIMFAPEKHITNAEFVVLLSKVLGLLPSDSNMPYININEEDWFAPYFRSAYDNNIITGTYGYNMNPLESIKREEMAQMIMDAYFYYTNKNSKEFLVMPVKYASDEGTIFPMFKKAVSQAYQMKLFVGDDSGKFNPKNEAKRAEAAIVIYKLLKLLELL